MAAVIGGGIGAGAVSAVHMMRAPDTSAAAFADAWMDLHTRCRTAMEESQPVDTSGLSKVLATRRDGIERVLPPDHTGWQGAENRIVLLDFAPSIDTNHTRGCRVEMADDMQGVHTDAAARILTEFLELRSALSAEGTHFARDPDPITPGFGVGYEAAAPNPDGCMAVTMAFFDPERGIHLSASYEDTNLPCRESSHNTHHGTSHA